MVWPFTRKLQTPALSVPSQLSMSIKSLSLPEATPRWWLFAQNDHQWSSRVAIDEGYAASSIVYTAVEKRAKLLASTPWRVERRRGDEWEPLDDHPLINLLERPNPDQSFYELMYEASQSLDLAGNAYLTEIRPSEGRPPVALWLLPAEYMKIKPGRSQLVEYYEYSEDGIRQRIQPEDLIHLKMPNPSNRWFGMPVLMAAGRATDVDRETGIWQKTSLQNRGVLDMHIEVPEGTTPEQIEEAKRQYREKHGGPDTAREPIFSSGRITQLGQTAVEMDFVASRRAIWTEIAAVFGVPLAAMGFTEDVNLANADAMMRQLWQNTIIPQLDLIKRQLNHQLASEFGDDIRLMYDLSNVAALQDDFGEKLSNAERLFRMGVPFNEINQKLELGFEDTEGGEVGYIPSGLIPASFDQDQFAGGEAPSGNNNG
jgi:HK97 family phage portal protein